MESRILPSLGRPQYPANEGDTIPGDPSSTCHGRSAAGHATSTTTQLNLNICSMNVRTLKSEDRLIELEEALKHINWDILGLSEVRRLGEEVMERENGGIFYHFW